jgi:hypothetical protein
VPGASIFFGNNFHPLDTLILWFAVIGILTLPWLILRPVGPIRLSWGLPIAITVSAFLPTGIANPITAAGVLFPGTAWFGIIFTLILFAALIERPLQTLAFAFCISLVCYIAAPGVPAAPEAWRGINTRFGGSGFDDPSPFTAFADAQTIQREAVNSDARVIVFPESVVKHWNDATDILWQNTFDTLRKRKQILVVGAEQTLPDQHHYSNVLIVRGAQVATYVQRVPIPYAMWMPVSGRGVLLNYAGPATITIGTDRVAPLICYEQLLVFPVLASMFEHPAILVGTANDYWARGTPIPRIQTAALSAWSRLFRVPVITAVNQ